jgi:bis(5'-nucleosyl)-tetraphosphatase (symmetrical)
LSTYAVGDVQGCYATLMKLLDRIRFDPGADRLWLVGDLVNRGPRSLQVLRWARELGRKLTVVLGNHDLHLLARAAGAVPAKRRDTLDEVLSAADCDPLIDWLKRRPLVHREGSYLMVHAGLLPEWTPAKARSLGREVQRALAGRGLKRLFASLGSTPPREWRDNLKGARRLRVLIDAFTRLRTCRSDGRMCLDFSGPPEAAPPGCLPWFAHPGRRSARATVIFGHWAALGFQRAPGILALDSACVWGGALSAVRLEDGQLFQEPLADRLSG